MSDGVLSCATCGAPLRAVTGQFLLCCRYCGNTSLRLADDEPPVVALRPALSLAEAKGVALRELRAPIVATAFRRNSYFEQATLYFVPFYEVRGVRAGTIERVVPAVSPPPPAFGLDPGFSLGEALAPVRSLPTGSEERETVFSVSTYEYLEPAYDLQSLGIGFLDLAVVEEALLHAEFMPCEPADLRCLGVLLPPQKRPPTSLTPPGTLTQYPVEQHVRTVYLPIWEVAYSFAGMVFRSFVLATDGSPLQVTALAASGPRRLGALAGLLALAALMMRSLRLAAVFPPALLLLGLGLGAFVMLFPFFWQLFAAAHLVDKRGPLVDLSPLPEAEPAFLLWLQRVRSRLSGLLGPPGVER